MKIKMSWAGIGPKLALLILPYTILAIVMMIKVPGFLSVNIIPEHISNIIGYVFLVTGLVFYGFSAQVFLQDFKYGKLITRGPFALCRNPIYATFIVFIIPALAFLFRSGMVWTIDIVLYMYFKALIGEEYTLLRENFGPEYDAYERSVREVLPFPKFNRK
jgi:protein-S-isoprenylcysteine O-methyltransferase Ste14